MRMSASPNSWSQTFSRVSKRVGCLMVRQKFTGYIVVDSLELRMACRIVRDDVNVESSDNIMKHPKDTIITR